MPLEIRELVIKVEVTGDKTSGGSSGDGGGDTKAIVAECVEAVLNILKEKTEM